MNPEIAPPSGFTDLLAPTYDPVTGQTRSWMCVDAKGKVTTPPSNSSGLGFFVSNGIFNGLAWNGVQQAVLEAADNTVTALQFQLVAPMTIGRCSVPVVATTGGAGSSFGFAIYDSNQNKVFSAELFDGTSVAALQSKTFPSVTLLPGVYYFAWTGIGVALLKLFIWPTALILGLYDASGAKRMGLSTNPAVAGAFPDTLGGLDGTSPIGGIPLCLWEAK